MNNDNEVKRIYEGYQALGKDSQGYDKVNGWSCKFNQEIRFRIINDIINSKITPRLIDRGLTVLDVGCGTGELSNYLKANCRSTVGYIGIDKFHQDIDYETYEVPNYVDVTVFSGSLTHIADIKDLFKFIDKAINTSKYGVIFNLLDDKESNKLDDGITYYHNKINTISYMLRKYSSKYHVSYRDDYLKNKDFTISLIKR